ncbi:pantoate kinase [Halomicroarcula sp. GCM10025324]|uniref:pantoate kinase n=1 Tax=Haloarcula TaxID=2237 RepID=UPI0023E81596|nr:pantoate kinase [Halomicroarcula sp. ZS-22-S1]
MKTEAEAFVPGHVTGFFTVDRGEDPTETGSRGGGLALSDGVRVTIRPAEETRIELDGERVGMDAVERVLDALGATARVTATTDLPLGAGFGVSGAMALGTALAGNAAFDRRLSYNELVTVAHGAEVQAGTGLGDVVGQSRGGIPLRLEPGAPGHNYVDAIPDRARIEYHTLGELSTADVVDGETAELSGAGERALSQVVKEPTLESFMRASRQFSREADLLTPAVWDVVTDVNEAGGDAAMAMLGETVFALGTGLTDAGYDANVCEVDPAGATVEPDR